MRILASLLAVSALAVASPAFARDDIMPPPKPAPRIPVDQQILAGSTQEQLTAIRLAREAKEAKAAAAAAAQPVVALGREVNGKGKRVAVAEREAKETINPPKDSREMEGKGEALDGERIVVGGKEIRLFGVVTPALTSSFGPQTRLNLDRMLSGSNVLCKVTNVDAEGKPVAFCGTVKVPDLSYEMLRQGWAMVDRRTLKGNSLAEVYEKAEQEAQNQNRGIFAPAPVALAVPVSDPTKAVTVPMPQQVVKVEPVAISVPVPPASVVEAPKEATLPDIHTAIQTLGPPKAEAAPSEVAQAAPVASSSSFVERYQILFGAFGLIIAAGVFGGFMVWRENKILFQRRQALAAALRGELMSARLICRTRARDLLNIKKTDIETKHPGPLWPRIRSVVYQAHVGQLGLLGAELARQVASVYGQCADYSAYYQSSPVRTPIPQVVGETLANLSEHIDTLLLGLQEVEMTGKALIGDDIMAEEEARAAAENVRLAVAAAHKRTLPPPTITVDAVKSKRVKQTAPQPEENEDDGDEDVAGVSESEAAEPADIKSARASRVA